MFWLRYIFVPFVSTIEDLVLEESPKWKLLADVLDEIERDDAKNDSKRKYHFLFCRRLQNVHFCFNCYASINSSDAHPPPPGNRGAFAQVVSPGGGALANFIAARGLGISIPWGDPRAFDTMCFRRMDEFIGKDEDFVKDWLVRQGLEKTCRCFLRYFFS